MKPWWPLAGQTEQGVIIYTVGFGSPEGEPIPEYDAGGQVVGFKRDDQGQVVLSILNADMLQKVALAANGTYYPVGAWAGPQSPTWSMTWIRFKRRRFRASSRRGGWNDSSCFWWWRCWPSWRES